MENITVEIETDVIKLDNLLKYAGLAATGGQAGQFVLEGLVSLNGVKVTEKRKKIRPGDKLNFANEYLITIKAKEI